MTKQVKLFSGHNEYQVETAVNEWISVNEEGPIKLHLASNDMGVVVMIEYGELNVQEIEPERELIVETH